MNIDNTDIDVLQLAELIRFFVENGDHENHIKVAKLNLNKPKPQRLRQMSAKKKA